MMIDGEATPAADRAAPNRRPEVAVERVWEAIVRSIVLFRDWGKGGYLDALERT